MTVYDAAMVGVIVAGMVWGAFRGITWQVASILSLVLGYTVSHQLSGQFAPYFPGEPVVARALAMIAIYFVVAGGIFVGAWLIRATLRRLKFEAFDRHLGMVLGGFEGTLVGLVVTLFVVSLAPATRDPIFKSPTGRVVGRVMATLGPVLPEEARSVLGPFWTNAGPELPDVPKSTPAASAVVSEIRQVTESVSPTPSPGTVAPRDGSTTPASFRELIEKSEQQIGKAVVDGATDGLKRAASGGTGTNRDGTAERR
jgi:uncharacterized membrane protein required for colicin V production